jgi:transglutaminase-like putative cysteine protease
MGTSEIPGSVAGGTESVRTVTSTLVFTVSVASELVLQVAPSATAGTLLDESLDVTTDTDITSPDTTEVRSPDGARMHIVSALPGRLAVAYRAVISARPVTSVGRPDHRLDDDAQVHENRAHERQAYERQVYLRPSRYCPSDHLLGFASAQFGTGPDAKARVTAITSFIRQRIGYVPGSSTVHDSAEDTLLTGQGTCRDFAHLGIALCRATGIPARFVSVYAPGLLPMDFHAVFEAFENGRWYVHDSTGLAPRQSLVRIVTGRDAADAAFAATVSGIADLVDLEVSATVGSSLPADTFSRTVELA